MTPHVGYHNFAQRIFPRHALAQANHAATIGKLARGYSALIPASRATFDNRATSDLINSPKASGEGLATN